MDYGINKYGGIVMQIKFCVQCGRILIYKSVGDEGEQKYCPDCNKFYFDDPASCIIAAIINENDQVLLLKQKLISANNYTLCSGYLKKGDTLEETVIREVFEETGQRVISCEYIQSYYFAPKNLIMAGFIAYVRSGAFGVSNEVDGLIWADLSKAVHIVERENNFSGIHLDNCIEKIKHKMNCTVRKIKISELPRLTELFDYKDVNEMLAENEKLIRSGSGDIFILIDGKRLLGELHVSYESSDGLKAAKGVRAYLYAFRIHKNFQGMGMGKLLLRTVLERLAEEGYTEFTVGAEYDNSRALHIYKKFGFDEEIARMYEEYQGDGYEYGLFLKRTEK